MAIATNLDIIRGTYNRHAFQALMS